MKLNILLLSLLTVAASNCGLRAQATATPATTQFNVPPPTPYAIVKQDANSRIWQREAFEAGTSGKIITNLQSYTELASGLNYKDSNGNWQPSKEEIDILPDGTAAATHGQHQVYFPVDIYNGAIELVTPDGI